MKRLLATLATLFAAACDRVPLEQPMPSQAVVSWDGLYLTHCAGCHGADGSLGAARRMRDPAYLATLSRDELIRVIGRGQGRLMPAFDQSAGGPLTAEEIARLADGMRQAWGAGGVAVGMPWSGSAGAAEAGASVYAAHCQACHGAADGRAPGTHGSVTDANYLRLASDQALRSAVLFGRADLGAGCDGRPNGRRLQSQEVADVVAFLISRRPATGRSDP